MVSKPIFKKTRKFIIEFLRKAEGKPTILANNCLYYLRAEKGNRDVTDEDFANTVQYLEKQGEIVKHPQFGYVLKGTEPVIIDEPNKTADDKQSESRDVKETLKEIKMMHRRRH